MMPKKKCEDCDHFNRTYMDMGFGGCAEQLDTHLHPRVVSAGDECTLGEEE